MSRIAYVNGAYLPHQEAAVHVEDRGLQFGDGVYEVIHVYAGRLIDEDRHLDRLARSLREIRLDPPMGREPLRRVLGEVARRNRLRDGTVYLQITRGAAPRQHHFPDPARPATLIVTARRAAPFPADPRAWKTAAITTPDLRWARRDIKSVNLLANVLARQAAREQGAFEAILIDVEGRVTEGAATSVWIVDAEGVLRTRALGHEILPGCTRGALLALLAEAGIGFEERAFTAEELRAGREAFLTSATNYVRPVVRIDGAPVGDGEVGAVTARLFALFARHIGAGARNHP